MSNSYHYKSRKIEYLKLIRGKFGTAWFSYRTFYKASNIDTAPSTHAHRLRRLTDQGLLERTDKAYYYISKETTSFGRTFKEKKYRITDKGLNYIKKKQ